MCISPGLRAKLGAQKGFEPFSEQNQLREKLNRDLGAAGEEQGANSLEKGTFPWKMRGWNPSLSLLWKNERIEPIFVPSLEK